MRKDVVHDTLTLRSWSRNDEGRLPEGTDARPRPRLAWTIDRDLAQDALRFTRFRLGWVWKSGVDGYYVRDATGNATDTKHPTRRDAAINLRLRFVAAGFDVDDVPAEILEGA